MTAEISVEATEGGFAAGRDQIINFAPSPELVAALTRPLEELTEKQRKQIDDLRNRLGTSDGILSRVAGILAVHYEQGDITFEQIPWLLIELAKSRQRLAERERERPEDPDPAFAELQKNLEEALASGDDAQARQLYEQKRDAKLTARKKRLEAAARLREAATRDLLDAAESEAGLGELAYGRLEYRRAAEHFRGAAELLSEDDESASLRLSYLDRAAEALYRQGDEFGDNEALREAVTAHRAALNGRTRERVPLQWAATQNNLGSALSTLGARETGTQRLEEVVAAYREVLQEYRRERVPLHWAMTQNNLATALSTLGEREAGTQRLEEAVAAYREALQEYRRERVPLQWAATQNNLGTALSTLGERETGTQRLEEAVAAYREALQERTRERVPLQWAATQNNLATALSTLGERETGTQRLEEAVAAYREALQKYTRERVPLQWAATQNNLGTALSTLGARETGTQRLEEAVAAYRDALNERTRERVPLDWAVTQTNLGNALSTLGERTGDRVKFAEARKAIEGAFDIFMQAGQEQHRGYFENRLQEIDRQIAALTPPR